MGGGAAAGLPASLLLQGDSLRLRGPFRSMHPHVVIGAGSRDLNTPASSSPNWRSGLSAVNDSLLHTYYGGGTPPPHGGGGSGRRVQPRRAVSAGPVRKLARYCADGGARPLSSSKGSSRGSGAGRKASPARHGRGPNTTTLEAVIQSRG